MFSSFLLEISGALVELIDDQGGAYPRAEQGDPGHYIITDPDFHAVTGVGYKLRVSVEGEAVIESSWETLPGEQEPIGTVGFHEVVRPMYKHEANEERNQGGFLQDTPPNNLKSNFEVISGDVSAFGYFAPVRETATRWYLVRSDLSYTVEDTGRADCLAPKLGPPAPQCVDCRDYEWGGNSTNVAPTWWR